MAAEMLAARMKRAFQSLELNGAAESQASLQKRAKQPAVPACPGHVVPSANAPDCPSAETNERQNSADDNNAAEISRAASDESISAADWDPPSVKLGYCSFSNGMEARSYISRILKTATLGQPLQEYELALMLDVLAKGHPYAPIKLSGGVKAILVAPLGFDRATVQFLQYARSLDFPARLLNHVPGEKLPNPKQKAFYVVHLDDSLADFSYLLCLRCLFARDAEFLQRPNIGSNHGQCKKPGSCGNITEAESSNQQRQAGCPGPSAVTACYE